jgi:hypothetical protein
LNEIGSVGVRNAIVGARCYVERAKALIEAFP